MIAVSAKYNAIPTEQILIVKQHDADFWRNPYIELKSSILNFCLYTLNNQSLSKRALLRKAQKEFRSCDVNSDGALELCVNRIIETIIEQVWVCVYQRVKAQKKNIKPMRPSVLMNHADQCVDQERIVGWVNKFYPLSFKPACQHEALLWLFYQLVMHGYGMETAISILTHLRQGDLNQDDNTLFRTPVHYEETGPYFHETELPHTLKRVFRTLLSINLKHRWVKGHGQAQQFALMQEMGDFKAHDRTVFSNRYQQLKKILTQLHRHAIETHPLPNQTPKGKDKSIPLRYKRIATFSTRLRENILTRIEPALFERLAYLPFPADNEGGIQRFLRKRFQNSAYISHPKHMTHRARNITPPPTLCLTGETIVDMIPECPDDESWMIQGKLLVDDFSNWLNQKYKPNSKIPLKQLPALRQKIYDTVQRACSLCPSNSALVMGFLWIGSKLTGDMPDESTSTRVNINTAREYLNAIIRNGFLDLEASYDLSDWDDALFDESLKHLCRRQKQIRQSSNRGISHLLADNTRSKRMITLHSFIKFVQYYGCFYDLTLNMSDYAYRLSKKRNQILTLHEFDSLLVELDRSGEVNADMVIVICILGFYGGLRSEEMRLLTLNEIDINRHEVWIKITHGKTASARRKIPLHLLAPIAIVNRVRRYYEKRHAIGIIHQTTGKKVRDFIKNPRQIAFLGIPNSPLGLSKKDINQVIPLIRYHTQSDIDIHTLRHCFATWLLIRTHQIKHHDFLETLEEQHHAVFTKDSQVRFLQLFQYGSESSLKPGNIDLYIHCRKLMGHSHIQVTFDHYMHCFGLIHSFNMKRLIR